MKLKELKDKVDKLLPQYADNSVVIPTAGLSGSCSEVKGISWGFDWHQGQVLLFPSENLAQARETRKYDYLFTEFLFKISNLKKVKAGEKVGKFRNETKTFDKHFEAEIWLYDKLKEELNSLK